MTVVSFLATFAGCSSRGAEDYLVIDTSRNYPSLDLDLEEVAEARYIRLEDDEDAIFVIARGLRRNIYIDDANNQIIISHSSHRSVFVAVYDMDGHLLRRIGRGGRGPGEYMWDFDMVYDPLSDVISLFCSSLGKVSQYRSTGVFLGDKEFSSDSFSAPFLLGDRIVFYNNHSSYFNEYHDFLVRGLPTLSSYEASSLEEVSIKDIHYGRIDDSRMGDFYDEPSIVPTEEGFLLTCLRSDTTYLLARDYELKPYLVNKGHNDKKGVLLPTSETTNYLFCYMKLDSHHPLLNFYAIRKADRKVFSIGKHEDMFWAGNFDKPYFVSSMVSSQTGYLTGLIYPTDLLKMIDKGVKLPEELVSLSEGMTPDSNAILVIYKMK